MQALLESLASALNHDPILATYAIAWLALNIWGVAVVILAYCSRLQERADEVAARDRVIGLEGTGLRRGGGRENGRERGDREGAADHGRR